MEEVFRMATQKVKPDPDVSDRQGGRQPRRQTYRKVGTYALVTAVVVVVVSLIAIGIERIATGDQAVGDGTSRASSADEPVGYENGSDDYGYRIPPAGKAVSTPVEGELIAKTNYPYPTYVRVYADGRVLTWHLGESPPCWLSCPGGVPFVERRLSPEGVELVRSGTVRPKDWYLVPKSAWEDREGRPYVPARYEACFWRTDSPPDVDVEALLDLLPPSAQALLSGSDLALNPRCLEVTPEEARSLEEILSQARSSRGDSPYAVGDWLLRDGNGDQVGINLHPLFPDGREFIHPGF
jgi:hypothetical protein